MNLPIVEIGRVPEIFVDALVQIVRVGPCFQLVFASPSVPVDCENPRGENTVCVRLIITAESVATLRRQLDTIETTAIDPNPRAELRAVN